VTRTPRYGRDMTRRGQTGLGAVAGAALCALAACGPRLSDDPEDFVGTADLRIGTLCSTASAAPGGEVWVKHLVLRGPGVTVDWASARLDAGGAEVLRRSAGREFPTEDGGARRFETTWFRIPAGAGSTVRLGATTLAFTRADTTPGTQSSAVCTVQVR